jgi:hypothetical protein
VFWRTVVEATCKDRGLQAAPYTCVLPIGLYNTRERATDSPAFTRPIPAKIPAFSQQQEEVVIHHLLSELNANYLVGLDPSPSFDRCVGPAFTEHGTGRTVFVGASHMSNIAKI